MQYSSHNLSDSPHTVIYRILARRKLLSEISFFQEKIHGVPLPILGHCKPKVVVIKRTTTNYFHTTNEIQALRGILHFGTHTRENK